MRSNLLAWATVGLLPVAAFAQLNPTATSIPFAPHGDAFIGRSGAVVPITSTSFIVAAEGPDGMPETMDDLLLLVRGLDGTPTITTIAAPFLADRSGGPVLASPNRVAATTAGPDGTFGTADDVVLLVQIGALPAVTPITVGFLEDDQFSSVVALDHSTWLVATNGPDGTSSMDDTVALITDVGGTNTITQLPAPFLDGSGLSMPVRLTSTSFLVGSNGPDGSGGSMDDVVYLFRDIGGANTRTDLATSMLTDNRPRVPVRVSGTRAVVVGFGPDGSEGTLDDVLYLLDDLDATPTVTPITVPSVLTYGGGLPVALSDSAVLIGTEGPDSIQTNADDTIAIVSDLGNTNTLAHVTVGGLEEDAQSQPVLLTPTRCAVATAGPDDSWDTMDDEVVVVSDLGTANTVTRITAPGLQDRVASSVRRISGSCVVVSGGGPDGNFGAGGDDVVYVISGIGGTPLVESVPVVGHFESTTYLGFVPAPLGGGRAAMVSGGPDNDLGQGGDDLMRVIEGLPTSGSVVAQKMQLKFDPTRPDKGEKISAKLALDLGGQDLLGSDVTVWIGNAVQTIPASRFVVSRNGTVQYKDSRGDFGWVRKLSYKPSRNQWTIKGKGLGSGAQTTEATYFAFGIAGAGFHFSESVVGEARTKGIRYKAPRN